MLPMRRSLFDLDFDDFRFPNPFEGFDLKTDIKEVGDNIEMEIDFPGFNKEDLNISIKDGMLLVEGVRNVNKDEKDEKGNFIRRERFSGRTSRSYYVGDVSEQDIKATFENGVLKVTYPKGKEALPETKKILIE
jgi:HSP20 family molecular chaperone IbpA